MTFQKSKFQQDLAPLLRKQRRPYLNRRELNKLMEEIEIYGLEQTIDELRAENETLMDKGLEERLRREWEDHQAKEKGFVDTEVDAENMAILALGL